MTQAERATLTLNEAIRKCIAKALDEGHYLTVPKVTRMVMEHHPREVYDATPRLLSDAIGKLVRAQFKACAGMEVDRTGGQGSLGLEELQDLPLPRLIGFPALPGEADPDEGSTSFIWVDLLKSNLLEVRRTLKYLRRCIQRDQKRYEAIRALERLATALLGPERQEEAIGPVLEELARRRGVELRETLA